MGDRRDSVLLAAVLGSSVVFLDGTVVNVALETIGADLPASQLGRLEGVTYVTTGYLAILAALLIVAGALGDRHGRRRVFATGLVGFGVTSLACGLAPTLEALVLARLAQGAAGALLVPGALALITASFEASARGRAIGLWATATSAVIVLGPVVGGVLVQAVSWRAVFLVNVPLILVALLALRDVPESKDETASGGFDWLGSAVIALAVGGLSFGATRGMQQSWQDPVAWLALAIGAAALVSLPVLMVRRPHPLVPPALFRSRSFTTINLSTLVVYGALYTTLMFLPLFLQGVVGYSPLAAGLAILPVGLLLTVLSTPAGRGASRVGPRPFLVAGPLLMAAGLLLLATIPAASEPWLATAADPASLMPPADYLIDVLPGSATFGFGLGLLVAPLTTALMGSVPLRNVALGSAINNAVSRVGAPLTSAVLFIVISATFYPALAGLVPGLDVDDPGFREAVEPLAPPDPGVSPEVAAAAADASARAFQLAMGTAAVLVSIGALVNGVGIRRREVDPAPAARSAERVDVGPAP